MIALVNVYRRPGLILVTAERLAKDNGWRTAGLVQTLDRDADDVVLGEAVSTALDVAAGLPADVRSAPTEVAEAEGAMYRTAGVRSERAFARDCDGVLFRLITADEPPKIPGRAFELGVTPLVSDRHGGFGAFGGEVEVPPGWTPEVLGRMCREAWDRGGVPAPSDLPDED